MNRQIEINSRTISDKPYVIAEIGCNHCGSIEIANEMVVVAAACGVDAVKFQKRTPELLFTQELLNTAYDSPHSYGKTYGEHRRALDWFGENEYAELKETAKRMCVDFIITPFTCPDADFVRGLEPDAIKIASCDLNNKPMLKLISEFGLPVILSTGGGSMEEIYLAVRWLYRVQTAILHCVSNYPVNDDQLNLNNIGTLKRNFESNVIGFSSHHSGILPHYIAYMLGARIFEAHFTLNRGSKGTDHGFSLEPDGLRRLCADLRRIDTMGGSHERKPVAKTGFVQKFGKSWHAARNIKKGELILKDSLCLLGPANYYQPNAIDLIAGHVASVDIPEQAEIEPGMLKLWEAA